MLKDITLGQFFPGNSILHRMDSRFKIILEIIIVVLIFIADNFISLAIAGAFVLMIYSASRIKYRMILKSLKPVMPLITVTAVLNVFFIRGKGLPLFKWEFITIYRDGVEMAVFMALRVVLLIIAMSLLTYTTSPIVLTDAIERLLSPLKKIRLPVHELAMMMTIALRFIPTLIEETDKIMMAQKARGADLDTGGIVKKAKALVPILIPLFVSAFNRANELAMAMECRCYRGGEGRTRLRQLRATAIDYIAFIIVLEVLVVIIFGNMIF